MSKQVLPVNNPYALRATKNDSFGISFRIPINLGDTVVFTILLKQLKLTYPNLFIVVDSHRTFNQENFEKNIFADVLINNKYIDLLILEPDDFLKLQGKPQTKYHYHMDILMIQMCFLGAWHSGAHEADLFCDIIGIPRPSSIKPEIYLTQHEIDDGKELLHGILNKNKKIPIIIHADAVNPLKQWPKSYWEELVGILNNSCTLIQVGTDKNWVIHGAINMIGKLSLRQIAALSFHAKSFIGIDSGIHHLCRAVNAKCIVIAPSIYPKTLWSYPEDYILIKDQSQIDCAYCEQNRFGMTVWELSNIPTDMDRGKYCCTKPICIEQITVQEVLEGANLFFGTK